MPVRARRGGSFGPLDLGSAGEKPSSPHPLLAGNSPPQRPQYTDAARAAACFVFPSRQGAGRSPLAQRRRSANGPTAVRRKDFEQRTEVGRTVVGPFLHLTFRPFGCAPPQWRWAAGRSYPAPRLPGKLWRVSIGVNRYDKAKPAMHTSS